MVKKRRFCSFKMKERGNDLIKSTILNSNQFHWIKSVTVPLLEQGLLN